MKRNYTYMVKCSDGTLYTGWTTDLEHRVRAHNDGEGAKFYPQSPARWNWYITRNTQPKPKP